MPAHTLRRSRLPAPHFIRSSGGPGVGRPRRGLLSAALQALLAWQDRAFERAALRSLDDRQLRDVGLTRADILAELAKPIWYRR